MLYKRTFTVHELALTGVMAALSLVAYLFFRIPFYGGSSFHLGNTFTALTALLLDGVSGGLAGAIGLALADILAGDPGYAITTFVLKFIIGITCGAVAHKVFKLRDRNAHEKGCSSSARNTPWHRPCPRSPAASRSSTVWPPLSASSSCTWLCVPLWSVQSS